MALPRVLLPAATTLAAGFLLGFAVGGSRAEAPDQELPSDLLAWEHSVAEALDLRAPQRADLRILLFHYDGERQKLLRRHLAEADEDWSALDLRFESLLKTRILDPQQAARAAELGQPRPVVAAAGPR